MFFVKVVFAFCLFTQLCPTLCDPMAYIVHGILWARILEWVAFPFSRGSSQPRKRTQVSCIGGTFFTVWVSRAKVLWTLQYPAQVAHPLCNISSSSQRASYFPPWVPDILLMCLNYTSPLVCSSLLPGRFLIGSSHALFIPVYPGGRMFPGPGYVSANAE